MRLAALCVIAVAGAARADLIAIGLADGTNYYLVSPTGEVELLGPVGEPLGSIAIGPDGRHYASGFTEVFRVNPFTGDADYLHGFSDVFASLSLACRDDGTLLSGIQRYGQCYLQGWNTYDDDWAPGVAPEGTFCSFSAHFRSDGRLVITRLDDPALYLVDQQTGELTPIGTLDIPGFRAVGDFGTDARTGQTYMTTIDFAADVYQLWTIDLYTAEYAFVADLSDIEIFGLAAITTCLADFDESGGLDILDFVAFQLTWQAGDGAADLNGDGALNILDFVIFKNTFQQGCP